MFSSSSVNITPIYSAGTSDFSVQQPQTTLTIFSVLLLSLPIHVNIHPRNQQQASTPLLSSHPHITVSYKYFQLDVCSVSQKMPLRSIPTTTSQAYTLIPSLRTTCTSPYLHYFFSGVHRPNSHHPQICLCNIQICFYGLKPFNDSAWFTLSWGVTALTSGSIFVV